MATKQLLTLISAAGLLVLMACGGQSVDTPTGLDVTTYPADQAFSMTLTLQACSDICAEYDEPSCSVNVKENDMEIEVNASISYSRNLSPSECPNRCGPPKKAICEVPALSAGVYDVVSGNFRRSITVQ